MGKQELTGPGVPRSKLMELHHATEREGDPTDWDAFLTHRFAPGVYARQFDLPEGSMVVGKIHKHAHLNFLMGGVVKVVSEFHTEIFAAPRVWVSEPGIKRAVYTLEDAMWITVHPNPEDCTDLETIEDEVIAPSYDQLDHFLAGRLEKQ